MSSFARQASLSMGFPRQEYCGGLPFPSHIYMVYISYIYIYIHTHTCIHIYIYKDGEIKACICGNLCGSNVFADIHILI